MQQLLINIIPYAVPVIVALIGFGLTKFTQLVNANVKNTVITGIIQRADDSIYHAVQFVGQTYADSLKSGGALSPDQMAQAKSKAIEAAKKLLTEQGTDELKKVLGLDQAAIDQWIGVRVESAVRTVKAPAGGSTAATPAQ